MAEKPDVTPNDKSLLDNPCPSHVQKSTLVLTSRLQEKKKVTNPAFSFQAWYNSFLSKLLKIR